MDGVIADLHTEWLRLYNEDYQDNKTVKDIVTWSMQDHVKKECGIKIFNYLKLPTLYDKVKPVDGAIDAIKFLRSLGHRVIVATTCVIGTELDKFNWLAKHKVINGEKDFLAIADKSLINADVLIDDRPHNLEVFKGVSVCFDQPYNKDYVGFRIGGWKNSSLDLIDGVILKADKQRFDNVLDEAKHLVYGNRQANYGHPLDNHGRTAQLWSTYLQTNVTPENVCMLNILQKVARSMNEITHDTIVDVAGYSENVNMILQERKRRDKKNG